MPAPDCSSVHGPPVIDAVLGAPFRVHTMLSAPPPSCAAATPTNAAAVAAPIANPIPRPRRPDFLRLQTPTALLSSRTIISFIRLARALDLAAPDAELVYYVAIRESVVSEC